MKILVVDDHPLILGALAALLPQLDDTIVVRAAAGASEAVAILDGEPDVRLVLLDLGLPGQRGQDLLADFLLDYPGVPVVILSATPRARMASSPRRPVLRPCWRRCVRSSTARAAALPSPLRRAQARRCRGSPPGRAMCCASSRRASPTR